MQFVSFKNKSGEERLGFISNGEVFDLAKHAQMESMSIPSNMKDFLNGWESYIERARKVEKLLENSKVKLAENMDTITMLACVPHANSLRDAYTFRQHVEAGRRNRGLEMIPEFDMFPAFYYSNRKAIVGPGDLLVEKDHLVNLDFELEAAIVIGRHGKNIKAEDADSYIAGYTIFNDFSARAIQMEEMKLSLGPAKGKDFASGLGMLLVTVDELEKYKTKTPEDHIGNVYDMKMKAYHNGNLVSEGNMKDMHWTVAEVIERISYGTEIYPGDIIGTGTVGTGCFLELNGTAARKAREKNQSFKPTWLEEGDEIELEIAGLGRLKNKVVLSKSNTSIFHRA